MLPVNLVRVSGPILPCQGQVAVLEVRDHQVFGGEELDDLGDDQPRHPLPRDYDIGVGRYLPQLCGVEHTREDLNQGDLHLGEGGGKHLDIEGLTSYVLRKGTWGGCGEGGKRKRRGR